MEDRMAEKTVVLFIDDDPLVLKAILRHYGWHPTLSVLAVLNADAALKLLDATRVDVVVSDLGMPSVDGVQFLRTVRQNHPRTACVFLSGLLDSFWLSRALQLTKIEEIFGASFCNDRTDGEPSDCAPCKGGFTPLIQSASLIEQMQYASVN
jgi:CheY-like chemotaxis protein